MIKRIFLFLIKIYQKIFSPDHGIFHNRYYGCRFYPSCSEYARQAISKYGPLTGLILGGKRILRCHPWSEGGIDRLR